jgi:alkaline phosphatase
MRSMGYRIISGAISLAFLWAGSAQAAKNIIILIGDGMGPEQVEAGRLLLDPGEELAMDLLDGDPGFASTLTIDEEVTDSAAAGTALATGCKTAYGNVSMAPDDVTEFPTAMEAAIDKGKATGLISDVYMCDATPAVWTTHAPRRSCSLIIPQQVEACVDVFLGPGEKIAYGPQKGQKRPDYIQQMVDNCNYEYVDDPQDLAQAQAPNDRLLGIWGGYTLMYNIDRQNDPGNNHPTLAEMTAKAIEVLKRDPDGFFLMVEGGALDWMAHNKDIAGVARDTLAFDDAVAVARNFAMEEDPDTLVVVTADHECGDLQIGDNPNVEFIAGITASTDFMWGLILRGEMSAKDVIETYTGLDWDVDLTPQERQAIADYGEMGISDALSAQADVSWTGLAPDEGNHSATEVPVYADGPGSEALEGHILNTKIGEALFQAVCPTCVPDCDY